MSDMFKRVVHYKNEPETSYFYDLDDALTQAERTYIWNEVPAHVEAPDGTVLYLWDNGGCIQYAVNGKGKTVRKVELND